MKKMETVIKPFKLDAIKAVLAKEGIRGVTISDVTEFNQQNNPVKFYRGCAYEIAPFPKVKIEVAVEDDDVQTITNLIIGTLRTKPLCDGEIIILPMDTTMRIRTGVR